MAVASVRLSKVVAHALRHEPWLYELELDDEGWVGVDQLLDALHDKGGAWTSVDRAHLAQMIESSEKRRYELRGDQIRSLYGHSVPKAIRREPATPPDRLFHGTKPATWAAISSSGLRPMRRQYVHLSVDVETARAVGRRRKGPPVILSVDAAGAHAAGVTFYLGNELVWLADRVPADFITPMAEEPG